MSFTVEKFEDFLTANNIDFKDNGRSVILQSCPECGDAKWKVWFSHDMPESGDRLLGKCFKCSKGWSSVSYLLESEIEKKEVLDLHEINRTAGENEGLKLEKLSLVPMAKAQEDKTMEFSLSDFIPMKDCLNSYHAKYAISRGVPPALYDKVLVDFKGGSIVFPVMERGRCVGYQKRLLKPADPSRKAHTPIGFEKGKHVLEYENNGDLLAVEGPFTAISGFVFGFHSLCTFGAGVSSEQLNIISEIAERTGKRVAVGYDTDAAGVKGLFKIKNCLERRGIEVYRVIPEFGSDLNDSWQAGKSYRIETPDESVDTSVPFLGVLEL